MKVLLDTCALADIRHPQGNARVKEAFNAFASDELFLSAITLGEIAKGIALLPESRKKQGLATWLLGLERDYSERILPIDPETARLWGEITARAQNEGLIIPAADGLIAATALRHGLHVMTRNSRHFRASGALVVDPWEDNPLSHLRERIERHP